MRKTYVVLGAGLQGIAATFDFARFGDAKQIVLADAKAEVAESAASGLNRLLNENLVMPKKLNVTDENSVKEILTEADVCLSAVPYYFNVALSRISVEAGCHFCDLGGNTDVVFQQHKLDHAAKKANVTIAPDCGLSPGIANILAVYGMKRLKHPKRVKIHVGGLPQNPQPPLEYNLSFNIAGLTNEYFGKANILRNGKVTVVETFSDLEEIAFPHPVGKCESFITYGGTSTCPWTFAGLLDEYEEKTVRYPGHYAKMKAIYDLGLLDEQPVQIGKIKIVPRQLFHAVAAPRLISDDPKDIVVLRVIVAGDDGKIVIELMDFYDETTNFTAMQRTTGFGAAIVGIMLAKGKIPSGSIRLEEAINPEKYVNEMKKRGFNLQMSYGCCTESLETEP